MMERKKEKRQRKSDGFREKNGSNDGLIDLGLELSSRFEEEDDTWWRR